MRDGANGMRKNVLRKKGRSKEFLDREVQKEDVADGDAIM
jgi:hypothetical protein